MKNRWLDIVFTIYSTISSFTLARVGGTIQTCAVIMTWITSTCVDKNTFRKTSEPDRILLTCPRARSMKLVVLITTVGYRLSF